MLPYRSRNLFHARWLLALLSSGAACGDDETPGELSDAGPSLGDASLGEPGGRIYATVSATDEVLVIDDASHAVLSSIPVGEGPAILLATPAVDKLYSANWSDDTVSAIDVASETVTSIDVGSRPYVIAMAPDGTRLYAGLNAGEIAVIDTATDTITEMFDTDELPASLIVSPDGATLYMATLNLGTLGAGTLYALDAATGERKQEPIEVGRVPAWITIGRDGSKVYTLNFLSDDVSVVDTMTWSLEATVPTGMGSQGIIGNVTPDGSYLYVTNYGSGDMIAIDTRTNTVANTIELDGRPVGVNFSPDGSRVYVTDFGPESLAASPLGGLGFLLSGEYDAQGAGQISVFDTATHQLIGSKLSVGPGPTSIVVSAP